MGDGEPACHGEDQPGVDKAGKSQAVREVKASLKSKQKGMLARASPAALHMKMPAREQQQQNGLASPLEDGSDPQHAADRPDNPRPAADHCDSGTGGYSDEAAGLRNNSERCQREGHGPFAKNGSHSPLVNNSMNGVPAFIRTEESREQGPHADCEQAKPPRPPSAGPPGAAGPGREEVKEENQPPTAELARLDLSGSPCRPGEDNHGIRYVRYESELQMPWIMRLITKDLSEPYSIYTYRYFIHNWPQLCFLVSTFHSLTKRVTGVSRVVPSYVTDSDHCCSAGLHCLLFLASTC